MATPSIPAVASVLTAKVTNDLIKTLEATPEDKAGWQPIGDARSILDQLVECCLANEMWTAILQSRVHAVLPEGVADQAYRELDTREKVAARLRQSSAALVHIISALPDDALADTIAVPWAEDVAKSVAECCFHPYWNMAYHEDQINYIQTLYADFAEHTNSGPFGI